MSLRIPYFQHGRRHGRYGSDPNPDLGPRIAYGQVANSTTSGPDSDGILDPGSGDWTVTGDDAGGWTVTFDPPFSSKPTVLPTENEATSSPPTDISLYDAAVDFFSVQTFRGGSLENDIGFNFVAVGV